MFWSVAVVDFESSKEIESAHALKLILIWLSARYHNPFIKIPW